MPPKKYNINGKQLVFPKDGEAGGTWMAASKKLTACLLNGAFEQHIPKPPYRKSRGLVLLDLFSFSSPKKFTKEYDFTGIEPFTIVAVAEHHIHEIRWGGSNIIICDLQKDKPHIWSSAQLYPLNVRQQREKWFDEWLQGNHKYTPEDVLRFHMFKGETGAEEEKIVIDRGLLKTVSISSIKFSGNSNNYLYYDLLSGEKKKVDF